MNVWRRVRFLCSMAVAACLAATAAAATEGDMLGLSTGGTAEELAALRAKIERLENQVPVESTNYRQHFDLANAYYDAGELAKAEARYRRAIALNPDYTEALVNLGSLLGDMGRNDDAVEILEQALAADPEDCKARSNLGNVYYSMGRYPDAMYEYQRAIDIDPACYTAHFNIAVAFADAGIFREAVKWWREVVRIAPGTAAARQAQENIELLRQFTEAPVPAAR